MYTINTVFLHITVSYCIGFIKKQRNKKHDNNKKSKRDEWMNGKNPSLRSSDGALQRGYFSFLIK